MNVNNKNILNVISKPEEFKNLPIKVQLKIESGSEEHSVAITSL